MDTFNWWSWGNASWIWIPFTAAFVVGLVVAILFLLNLRDLLQRVDERNRAMEPDRVWLNLIPFFNLVWMFITVIKVKDSLEKEYRSRNWSPNGDFGFTVGLAAAVLTILSWGPLGLAGVICWIIYWSKTSEIKNQLKSYGPHQVMPAPGSQSTPSVTRPTPVSSDAPASKPGASDGADQGSDAPTEEKTPAESVPAEDEAGSEPGLPGDEGSCPYCGATYRSGARYCSKCGRTAV